MLHVSGWRVEQLVPDSSQGRGLQCLRKLREFGPGIASQPVAGTGIGDSMDVAAGTRLWVPGGL